MIRKNTLFLPNPKGYFFPGYPVYLFCINYILLQFKYYQRDIRVWGGFLRLLTSLNLQGFSDFCLQCLILLFFIVGQNKFVICLFTALFKSPRNVQSFLGTKFKLRTFLTHIFTKYDNFNIKLCNCHIYSNIFTFMLFQSYFLELFCKN